MKRSHEGEHDASSKRHKHDSTQNGHKDLPPATSQKSDVPPYTPFRVNRELPVLPQLAPALARSPFRHKSMTGYDRSNAAADVTYERLEFLGDAYLELIASRLIFHHFPNLTAGNQSQIRELLVKNETLAEYARAYRFDERIELRDKETMTKDAKNRGNKGINKILGDCVEAYTAAVVLSDHEHGFAIAEKWLTALWTPKLLEATRSQYSSALLITNEKSLDTYDPTAKATLQQKILSAGSKLEYEPYRESQELKGDQLGQNRHYISLYLTGFGYTRKLLGKGEGKNKIEAGNWAATRAMHGECSSIVNECAMKVAAIREQRKKAQEAEAALGS